MTRKFLIPLLILLAAGCTWPDSSDCVVPGVEPIDAVSADAVSADAVGADEYDVVVYGGTSAGVTAAVQVARMGRSVLLIEPGKHLGAMTTSGLGHTDFGFKQTIGGLALEFYGRVRQHYAAESAWKEETFEEFKQARGRFVNDDAMWNFEPSVAEAIVESMVREAGVPVLFNERLDRSRGIVKKGAAIVEIGMESGRAFRANVFVDATFEGDLLAAAGVSYLVGREPNALYGETLNGVEIAHARYHQFVKPVDPYVIAGDSASGLLPGIIGVPPGEDGDGDAGVQAYNFRVCMTDDLQNRLPFAKPADYDPLEYELLLRNFEAGDMRLPLKIDRMPNRKTDLNNRRAVSTDWIGRNHHYAEASYAERHAFDRALRGYTLGLLWTLANHPRVPGEIRAKADVWGLARDEFTDTGHLPFQMYVREARRMKSTLVMTQHHIAGRSKVSAAVGLGSYTMDSHNVWRYVDGDGHVRNEGDVQVGGFKPYAIGYGAIVPPESECTNLLVPVCVSASHIAFGSIRMEPVFMVLGQSAGTAAVRAIEEGVPVQRISYKELRHRLLEDGQKLDSSLGS